ncbi:MAG: ferredoxin [Oscillibacter sp.]
MQITIDAARCIGCGMCAAAVPTVFRLVGRVSTVIAQPERSWAAFDAANGCPVNAITILR